MESATEEAVSIFSSSEANVNAVASFRDDVPANRSGSAEPHVAHILPWNNVGGTEIATLRLVRAAAAGGHRATAFHLPEAHPVKALFAAEGIDTAIFEEITPSYRHVRRYVTESRALAQRFRESGITALHCADVRGAFMCGLAGRLAGVPVICHVRNRYRSFPLRSRVILRSVNHFVFVSRQTEQEFAVRIAPHRASVLYDGIRMPEGKRDDARRRVRAELGIRADAPVIGMVARVARQKDFETLIRAAEPIVKANSDIRFLVVGDHESATYGTYYRELRDLMDQLQISESFLFTGHRQDVDALLDAFDVFVLSTHWEGFPLVILEAMAHQLPVVATAVDGIPEIVKHRETGLLVDEGDVPGLAHALEELVADRVLASRLGASAHELVSRNFSDASYTAAVKELYGRLFRTSPEVTARG